MPKNPKTTRWERTMRLLIKEHPEFHWDTEYDDEPPVENDQEIYVPIPKSVPMPRALHLAEECLPELRLVRDYFEELIKKRLDGEEYQERWEDPDIYPLAEVSLLLDLLIRFPVLSYEIFHREAYEENNRRHRIPSKKLWRVLARFVWTFPLEGMANP